MMWYWSLYSLLAFTAISPPPSTIAHRPALPSSCILADRVVRERGAAAGGPGTRPGTSSRSRMYELIGAAICSGPLGARQGARVGAAAARAGDQRPQREIDTQPTVGQFAAKPRASYW